MGDYIEDRDPGDENDFEDDDFEDDFSFVPKHPYHPEFDGGAELEEEFEEELVEV